MKRLLLSLCLVLSATSLLSAEVVRPAPDVQWLGVNGIRQNLILFRGQSVILLIAPSPRSVPFRAQVGQLQLMYQRLAAEKIICLAAFTEEPGVIKSNIPFALVADGPRAAIDYQAAPKFSIAVIGRDGNLDCVSSKVLPVQRIYDIINNSFEAQQKIRK